MIQTEAVNGNGIFGEKCDQLHSTTVEITLNGPMCRNMF